MDSVLSCVMMRVTNSSAVWDSSPTRPRSELRKMGTKDQEYIIMEHYISVISSLQDLSWSLPLQSDLVVANYKGEMTFDKKHLISLHSDAYSQRILGLCNFD